MSEDETPPWAPPPPTTGDDAVDAACAELAIAVEGPLQARVSAFDLAHRALQGRLADVEG